MESQCLADFKLLIREADYDNTYKMAWAKAIVELSIAHKEDAVDILPITIREIAPLMIKYYWNQTIFFDLIQGSNLQKPPKLLQYTKDLIQVFYSLQGSYQPQVFEKAVLLLQSKAEATYEKTIAKAVAAIKENVAYRFTHLRGTDITSIYSYQEKANQLYLPKRNLIDLADNAQDLFDLINYRWSLILETFNSSPRINKKVRIIDERGIKRSPLERFDQFLDVENPNHICFVCGKKIEDEDLSRDHVIPWSYLFSDDLWNLVYVHKSCNSVKSNKIPTQEEIDKLKKRNGNLLKLLEQSGKTGKEVDELKVAIKHHLVDQFYIGCKG